MGRENARELSTIQTAFAVAGIALIAAACSSDGRHNPTELRDTTGMKFQWECDDKGCGIGPMPAFETCSEPTAYTYSLDRFFPICAAFFFRHKNTLLLILEG